MEIIMALWSNGNNPNAEQVHRIAVEDVLHSFVKLSINTLNGILGTGNMSCRIATYS